MSENILDVIDLSVEIPTRHNILKPVDGLNFNIKRGEILGVVGESGAGKSMAGNAIIGLLERPAHIADGEIWLNKKRIDNLPAESMRKIRGKEIGMIFQDPLTSLNPLLPIGEQLTETIIEHLKISKKEALDRAIALLEEVRIPAATQRINAYPHQFSGGMRQRVVIALALAAEPSLVIADEPTTALDVSVQAQIISVLKKICKERGTAIMLITHDMGVIAESADRVAVMYSGQIVEIGKTYNIIKKPRHPYTVGLMGSIPALKGDNERLVQIPGSMPRLNNIPPGCSFHPRCEKAFEPCYNKRPLLSKIGDSKVACWLYDEGYKNG